MFQFLKNLAIVVALLGSVSSVPAGEPNRLDFFVGRWKTANHYLGGEMGPAGTSNGYDEFHWGVGNKWLVFDSELEMPGMGPYRVHGLIAQDEKTGHYRAFVFNNLSATAIEYDGVWEDEATFVFTSTSGPNPGHARVIYKKRGDGTVRFSAERSVGAAAFETYFEATLSR